MRDWLTQLRRLRSPTRALKSEGGEDGCLSLSKRADLPSLCLVLFYEYSGSQRIDWCLASLLRVLQLLYSVYRSHANLLWIHPHRHT